MSAKKAKPALIKCGPEELDFQNILGGAVIVHWDDLSTELQTLLIKQASMMGGRPAMTSGEYQIGEFIKKHKGGDI